MTSPTCPVCGATDIPSNSLNKHVEDHFKEPEPMVECQKCHQQIAKSEFVSHSDFHEAELLSEELNNQQSQSFTGGSSSSQQKRKPSSSPPQQQRSNTQASSSSSVKRMASSASINQQRTFLETSQDLSVCHFTFANFETEPASRIVKNLIPKLQLLLMNSQNSTGREGTQCAYLCNSETIFICNGSVDKFWGCGFRNAQMLMSAMFNIPAFQSHFKIAPKQSLCRTSSSAAAAAPSPPPSISPNTLPSVRYLQTMIEAAWQNGFDRDGASHFKFKLVNSRSWIGTTEICAMMRYYGVKAYCFDVREPSGPNNSHPDIFDFVERYYQGTLLGIDSNNCGSGVGSSSITTDDILVTDRPPIYFQHQGHSRTIVGIEKLQTGLRRLLIFDPADRSVSNAVNSPNWESNFLAKGFLNSCRLGNDDLSKRKQYQLLVVGGTTNWDRNSFNEAKIIYPNIIAHHL